LCKTLKNYVQQIREQVCFDKIVEIKKAIQDNDHDSALISLGELREQLVLLNRYIDSIEHDQDSKGGA
jgi:hypothetical protein